MKSAVVLGNGESRSWFCPDYLDYPIADLETWGCNAIYRDGVVDNLVSMDYAMQQEIYMSDYVMNHKCWFGNWNRVPMQVAEMMLMGFRLSNDFIHWPARKYGEFAYTEITDECVISGKDPVTLEQKISDLLKEFPHLDTEDLKLKLEKDMGIWITPVNDGDCVQSIMGHEGWSTGNAALSLACQEGASEIYLLGFDLSSYDEPLNNIYKGTDNYLPSTAKGFNPVNWISQLNLVFMNNMDKNFYWVDNSFWSVYTDKFMTSNLEHIDKNEFLDRVGAF